MLGGIIVSVGVELERLRVAAVLRPVLVNEGVVSRVDVSRGSVFRQLECLEGAFVCEVPSLAGPFGEYES